MVGVTGAAAKSNEVRMAASFGRYPLGIVSTGFIVAFRRPPYPLAALAWDGKRATRLNCNKHATKTSLENVLIILFIATR